MILIMIVMMAAMATLGMERRDMKRVRSSNPMTMCIGSRGDRASPPSGAVLSVGWGSMDASDLGISLSPDAQRVRWCLISSNASACNKALQHSVKGYAV
jgi:hypothetical protein